MDPDSEAYADDRPARAKLPERAGEVISALAAEQREWVIEGDHQCPYTKQAGRVRLHCQRPAGHVGWHEGPKCGKYTVRAGVWATETHGYCVLELGHEGACDLGR